MIRWQFIFWVLVFLSGCATQPPVTSDFSPVTPIPALDAADANTLCQTAQTTTVPEQRIEALEALAAQSRTCGDQPIPEQLYAAYTAYGAMLENRGRPDAAVTAYLTAATFPQMDERAADALVRLGAAAPQLLESCEPNVIEAATLPPYEPTTGEFVRLTGDTFSIGDIRGINYEPRDAPGAKFLTDLDGARLNIELDLIQEAEFNVLRVFLHHDTLFQCPGDGAVPVPDAFANLERVLQAAAARDMYLIAALNQDADQTLYNDLLHRRAQMRFLAERYQNEPTLLAWDLRTGGDADYATVGRETVLSWLSERARMMQDIDRNHLVTATWTSNAADTAPVVDFVSFQHFNDVDSLRQKIAIIRDNTDKPVLLSAVGYSTLDGDEVGHRNRLYDALQASENNNLLGWVVYSAFDHPLTATCIEPNCPGDLADRNRYGMWNTSDFPKLMLEAVGATLPEQLTPQ